MPRMFRIEDAQRILPDVARTLAEAIELRAQYATAESELNTELRRITMMGGSLVDRTAIADEKRRRQEAAQAFNAAIERIHSFGCQVKDLDMGLIDFPTTLRGREVCLCWKAGEPEIAWWHGADEGFRGRKPIDEDFLQNHQGDPES